MFGNNLFLSDKIVESCFCDCEDECLLDRWRYSSITFVLRFEDVAFVFCRDPSTFFDLERLLSCVKIAFIANGVFSKTCPEEIATVFFWSTLQREKELEQIIARTHLVMH